MIKFRTTVRIVNRLILAAFLVFTPVLGVFGPSAPAHALDLPAYEQEVNGLANDATDKWGFGARNCTSFVAYMKRNVTYHGKAFTNNWDGGSVNTRWSNAENWDTFARSIGYAVDSTPAVGAVAQWDGGTGHVAIVTGVHGSNIDVVEYNYASASNDYSLHQYGHRENISAANSYIHLERNLPGGWWQGPSPSPNATVSAGQTITLSAHIEDNGLNNGSNGGLRTGNLTIYNSATNSWQIVNPATNAVSGSAANITGSYTVPSGTNFIRVSFDVYSNTPHTNPTVFQKAPMGVRQYCVSGGSSCPAVLSYDLYNNVTPPGLGGDDGGGSGGGSGSSGSGCVPGQYQAAVFTDPNYGGSCVIKGIGEYPNPDSIGLPNDSISSIKVGSGANVRLCANDGLNSPCEYFSQDDNQLNYFDSMPDNATSSMKVEGGGPTTNCQPGESEVAFFMNENYQETCTIRGVGRYDDPSALGLPNDTISSVKVGARVRVRICDNNGNNSPCDQFENNVPDLTPTTVQNNRASSAEVTLKGGIALCDNTNYGGECKYFGAGDTGENLQNMSSHGFDNRVESVRYDADWAGLYHIVLYTDQNQTGYLYHADNSTPDLHDPYNNNISSIKIYKNHPPSAWLVSPANAAVFPATTTSVTLTSAEGQEKRVHIWNASGYDVTTGWDSSETYTANNLTPGTYSWQAQSRSPYVGEGAWSAIQTFSINTPPVVSGGSLTMDAGTTQSIQVQAYDAEQGSMTLAASGLPGFAAFTDNHDGTATLALNPSASQAGQYAITVTASDGSVTGTGTIDLTVNGSTVPPVTLSGTYKLVNPQSGKVLDVDNGGTWDGAVVHLWSDDNGADQQWQPVQNTDGSYKLVNPNSGKVLDVDGGNTADGTKVQLWADNGSSAQQWYITQNTDGTVTLTNTNSDKVLDVNGGSSDNGTKIQIWTPNESGAQKWQFVQVTPPPAGSYQAEYFNNTDLSGTPVLTRNETAIDYDWGGGSPHASVNVDGFSARWTRTTDFAAGGYNFTVRADDGIRLTIDGQTVIDEWVDQGPTSYTANRTLTAGSHTIVVEYYDSGGGAVAEFGYVPGPTINPGDYTAMYFDNQDLEGSPVLVRGETTIDHNWGANAPDAAVPADWFSARYVKTADFAAGTYRFTLAGDDGVRLFIDGQTIIDEWEDHGLTGYVADRTLSAGPHEIVVDYYDAEWDAAVNFGYALAPSGTNYALTGTGYRWWKNTSATSNSNRVAASVLNNDNTLDETSLRGSTTENANAWEGAGVVWSSNKTISHFEFFNGARDGDDDGVFTANFKLQFTTDGTTWTNATATTAYDYDSWNASGKLYTFNFNATSVRGVRVVGQVRTSGANSWLVYAREVRAY